MRPIDVDTFLEEYCWDCEYRKNGMCKEIDPICEIVDWLMDAPTLDAVEVVRCKDCRWFCPRKEGEDFKGLCDHENGLWGLLSPKAFCSYGEKKENG